jgi:biopolymer transport protein ExbB/TolQ
MDKIFSNFNINTEFIVLAGVLFSVIFMITIIIVIFVTKIKGLKSILEQAKEIDKAKIEKIAKLEAELEAERKKSSELSQELKFLPKNKQKLDEALEYIDDLKRQISMESKDNINTLNRHRLNFEKLNVNYELLNKSYIKLGERYQRLKDRNEILAK